MREEQQQMTLRLQSREVSYQTYGMRTGKAHPKELAGSSEVPHGVNKSCPPSSSALLDEGG